MDTYGPDGYTTNADMDFIMKGILPIDIQPYLSLFSLGVPLNVVITTLVTMTLIIILLIIVHEKQQHLISDVAFISLAGYIFLTLCSTVYFRETTEVARYKMVPLWSYAEIAHGATYLIRSDILNVLLFVPVGFLISIIAKSHCLKYVILCGSLFSVVIEFMQLFFKKGYCEFDDVFHNTIGCVIGYYLFKLAIRDGNNLERL